MYKFRNTKQYDLEERTWQYARSIYQYCKIFEGDIHQVEIIKQLIRSACSVGANYIEANEALGKRDFLM